MKTKVQIGYVYSADNSDKLVHVSLLPSQQSIGGAIVAFKERLDCSFFVGMPVSLDGHGELIPYFTSTVELEYETCN